MGKYYLPIQRRLKKPLIIFAVIILFFSIGISCTTTSVEEISDNEAIEKPADDENGEVLTDEEIAEEVAEPFYLGTYQEQNYPELRIAYKESTELLPEDVQIKREVFIGEWELARIIIPKIDVDLIVLGGVDVFDEDNLAKGPVHFGEAIEQSPHYKGSQPNTESGNVAIAGHRIGAGGKYNYFLDLDLLEEGDEIYLDIDGYRFKYHVQWQKVVDKYDWSCLEPTDYPALTLQTCEPKEFVPDPDYRLMLRAGLHEVTTTPGLD